MEIRNFRNLLVLSKMAPELIIPDSYARDSCAAEGCATGRLGPQNEMGDRGRFNSTYTEAAVATRHRSLVVLSRGENLNGEEQQPLETD
jgi:hypothetical protein